MALLDNFRQALGRSRGEKPNPGGLVMAEGSGRQSIELSATSATYETLYEQQPVVAAAVNKLTRQIATIPIRVYREMPGGDRQEVFDHPLNRLLTMPAPGCGAHTLGQWIALPTLTFGNSLVVKVRGKDGLPVGLLPVDWRFVNAYAEMGERVKLWSTIQTGEELWINPSEAIHFAWLAPRGWLGISPLMPLGKTLRLEDSALRYQVANFDNGVRPTGALTLEKDVDPESETGKRLRAQLRKLHEGVDNTGRTMLLGGGAKFERMAQTAVEAELIQQRRLNREEVGLVFDMSLGDKEGRIYVNIEEVRQLYKTTLRPWLEMIAGTIKAQLIDPEPDWRGLCVRFDYSEFLRGDPAAELSAIAEAKREGLISTNEGRRRLGFSPLADPRAEEIATPATSSGDTPADSPVVAVE